MPIEQPLHAWHTMSLIVPTACALTMDLNFAKEKHAFTHGKDSTSANLITALAAQEFVATLREAKAQALGLVFNR